MSIALIIVGAFVIGVMIVGNVVETKTQHPQEDLRKAYAPDLIQVLVAEAKYEQRQHKEYMEEEKRRKQEVWDRYNRQVQDAYIRRWLEGNPVTDENPLRGKEIPTPPV